MTHSGMAELFIRCSDGAMVRVPAHVVRSLDKVPHRKAGGETGKLLRTLVARKLARTK